MYEIVEYFLGMLIPRLFYTTDEIELKFPHNYSRSSRATNFWKTFGYMHLQATKPDTLAHALTDSPVGLMAYILEKYSSWSFNYEREIEGKRDGGLGNFSKDALLTIVTVFWMTNSISSSVRFYKANLDNWRGSEWPHAFHRKSVLPRQVRVAVLQSEYDIELVPANVTRMRYPNLVKYKIIRDAGHFTAFENPELAAKNFVDFVLDSVKVQLK